MTSPPPARQRPGNGRSLASPKPSTESAVPTPDALAERLVAIEPRAASDPSRIRVVHAPGRVNVIGEHTDYNEGFVLPAAIDLGISIAFLPADDVAGVVAGEVDWTVGGGDCVIELLRHHADP